MKNMSLSKAIFACLLLTAALLPPLAPAQTPPAPESKVLVISASEFVAWTAGDRLRGATLADHYLFPEVMSSWSHFSAPLHLPDGALISAIELDACDDGADNAIVAVIEAACDPGVTCDPGYLGNAVGTQTGCVKTIGDQISYPIDNRSAVYRLALDFTQSGPPAKLKAVRIYYRIELPPAPATATFSDVPTTHPFYRWVEAMAAAGYTAGCGDGKFCPDAPVTRGQLSVFIGKAADLYIPQQ